MVVSDTSSEREPAALFLLSIETGEKRRITSPPQKTIGDVWPAFSPDGHVLVFVRVAYFRQDLYALELSNDVRPVRDPKRLTFAKAFNRQPAWTADGRSIVYVSGESPHHPSLWRMTLKNPLGPRAPLRQLPLADANWPAISRQGRLVYGRRIWDFDIWRLELGGSGRRERLPSNSTRLEHTPQYSPDGKRIAFASDRSGSHEIWVCGGDGSHPVKLTSFGGPYLSSPSWSPDGRETAGGSISVQSGVEMRRSGKFRWAGVLQSRSQRQAANGDWNPWTEGSSTTGSTAQCGAPMRTAVRRRELSHCVTRKILKWSSKGFTSRRRRSHQPSSSSTSRREKQRPLPNTAKAEATRAEATR